jgi:chemotaxis methyl-accepting protein methylase
MPAPRVLSVGCSDGSELYSLPICLQESGARGFCLHGIDCRRRAIERARAGVYAASALDALPPLLREKYFDHDRRGYRIKEPLRHKSHWHLADAFLGLPAGPYDLIACRNVAIYLEHAAAARLWRRLHSALRPGGLLLTGKAERPTSGFLRAGPCQFRKALP